MSFLFVIADINNNAIYYCLKNRDIFHQRKIENHIILHYVKYFYFAFFVFLAVFLLASKSKNRIHTNQETKKVFGCSKNYTNKKEEGRMIRILEAFAPQARHNLDWGKLSPPHFQEPSNYSIESNRSVESW